MSDALKIAEQRLAKGEISLEEFQQLKQTLSASNNSSSQTSQPVSGTEEKGSSMLSKSLKMIGAAILLVGFGNFTLVIPDEESKLAAIKNTSSASYQVQANEVKNIKNRTKNFFIFGTIILAAGAFMGKSKRD